MIATIALRIALTGAFLAFSMFLVGNVLELLGKCPRYLKYFEPIISVILIIAGVSLVVLIWTAKLLP